MCRALGLQQAKCGRDDGNPDRYMPGACDMTTQDNCKLFKYIRERTRLLGGAGTISARPIGGHSTPVAAPSLSPHWNGFCNALSTTYMHNGCPLVVIPAPTTVSFFTTTSIPCPRRVLAVPAHQYCTNGGTPSCAFGSCSCPFGGAVYLRLLLSLKLN